MPILPPPPPLSAGHQGAALLQSFFLQKPRQLTKQCTPPAALPAVPEPLTAAVIAFCLVPLPALLALLGFLDAAGAAAPPSPSSPELSPLALETSCPAGGSSVKGRCFMQTCRLLTITLCCCE